MAGPLQSSISNALTTASITGAATKGALERAETKKIAKQDLEITKAMKHDRDWDQRLAAGIEYENAYLDALDNAYEAERKAGIEKAGVPEKELSKRRQNTIEKKAFEKANARVEEAFNKDPARAIEKQYVTGKITIEERKAALMMNELAELKKNSSFVGFKQRQEERNKQMEEAKKETKEA